MKDLNFRSARRAGGGAERRGGSVRRLLSVVTGIALIAAAAACGTAEPTPGSTGDGPRQGGDLTIMVVKGGQSEFPSLDPIRPGTTNSDYRNAVFGSMFHAGKDGVIEPQLAAGYEFSPDNLTVTISLRPGVKFSDGTPLDADAVVWNYKRALDPANACECKAIFDTVTDVRAEGTDKVIMTLSKPFAAFIPAFPSTALNWIASPTAFEELGEQRFSQFPVGAGPYIVKSNDPSQKLELERNPNYYLPGQPYLDSLTFQVIGSDQSAVSALQAGSVHVVEAVTTIPLLQQAKQQFQLIQLPVTKVWELQFNTLVPPLDDQRAREALIYATDIQALNDALYLGLNKLTQSPTASGGLFYTPTVPGAKTYDLDKAKELVEDLGGLTVTISSGMGNINQQNAAALQAMWSEAGIEVSQIRQLELADIKEQITTKRWNVHVGRSGAFDPALRLGIESFFGTNGANSGVADRQLDALITEGAAETDIDKRADIYQEAFELIADKSYAGFMFEDQRFFLAANSVVNIDQGVGEIDWQSVSLAE